MALINYDIDFTKMIKMLMGPIWRKSKRIAWLKGITKPIRQIHDRFITFTEDKIFEVKFNGQTFLLEKMLHAQFGPGIYIENNIGSIDGLFVGEGADVSNYIGDGQDTDTYIDIEYDVALFSFTVFVPATIVFVQAEMEAYIRRYKLTGTTFNIVII